MANKVVQKTVLQGNEQGYVRAMARAEGASAKLRNAVRVLGGAFTAFVGFSGIRSAINAFKQQEQSVAKLNNALTSMGRSIPAKEIQDFASQLQKEGIFGDEAIIEGAAMLATFREISDEAMPRAIRTAADLAAQFGMSMETAAKTVGKAAMGMTGELSRYGISLSEAAKESKDFNLIMSDIEAQVQGANKALGDTATGGITQMEMAWGDFMEAVGKSLAETFQPAIREITDGITRINEKLNLSANEKLLLQIESARDNFVQTILSDPDADYEGVLTTKAEAVAAAKRDLDTLLREANRKGLFVADDKTRFNVATADDPLASLRAYTAKQVEIEENLAAKREELAAKQAERDAKRAEAQAEKDAERKRRNMAAGRNEQLAGTGRGRGGAIDEDTLAAVALREQVLVANTLAEAAEAAHQLRMADERRKAAEAESVRMDEQFEREREARMVDAESQYELTALQQEELMLLYEEFGLRKSDLRALQNEDELAALTEHMQAKKRLAEFEANNEIAIQKKALGILRGLQIGGGKAALAIQSAIAVADSYLDWNKARMANTAWAAALGPIVGPPYKAAADGFATTNLALSLAGIAAKGALQLNKGGIVPGGGPFTDRVPALLTPGEAIIPKDATDALLRAGSPQRVQVEVYAEEGFGARVREELDEDGATGQGRTV